MSEIWTPVLSFEDYYEVSNFGRIRKRKSKKLLIQRVYCNKYTISLSKIINGEKIKFTNCFVDSIVIQSFLGVCYTRCNSYVYHLNGDLFDNRLDNLAYHLGYREDNCKLLDLFYIEDDKEIFIKRGSANAIANYLKISRERVNRKINKIYVAEDYKQYLIKTVL